MDNPCIAMEGLGHSKLNATLFVWDAAAYLSLVIVWGRRLRTCVRVGGEDDITTNTCLPQQLKHKVWVGVGMLTIFHGSLNGGVPLNGQHTHFKDPWKWGYDFLNHSIDLSVQLLFARSYYFISIKNTVFSEIHWKL